MLAQRRKLLQYLRRADFDAYAKMLSALGLKDRYMKQVDLCPLLILSKPRGLPLQHTITTSALKHMCLFFRPVPMNIAHYVLLPLPGFTLPDMQSKGCLGVLAWHNTHPHTVSQAYIHQSCMTGLVYCQCAAELTGPMSWLQDRLTLRRSSGAEGYQS